jgi:hypothetical protein
MFSIDVAYERRTKFSTPNPEPGTTAILALFNRKTEKSVELFIRVSFRVLPIIPDILTMT